MIGPLRLFAFRGHQSRQHQRDVALLRRVATARHAAGTRCSGLRLFPDICEITLACGSGVELATIQRLLGHEDIATAQMYAHDTEGRRAVAHVTW